MNRLQELVKQERMAQDEIHHQNAILEETKNQLLQQFKDPNQNSKINPSKIKPDVKSDPDLIKVEPVGSNEPLLPVPIEPTCQVINPEINVLNPTSGMAFKSKPKPSRGGAKNPLARDIQNQARSHVPDKNRKKKKEPNGPVRSFLPNMNPYTHRNKDKNGRTDVEEKIEDRTNPIPAELPPVPVDRKRPNDNFEAQLSKKKAKASNKDDEWADLPQVIIQKTILYYILIVLSKFE